VLQSKNTIYVALDSKNWKRWNYTLNTLKVTTTMLINGITTKKLQKS